MQQESIMVDGQVRYPDFFTSQTLKRYGAVFESKNKQALSIRDGDPNSDYSQIDDFATFAHQHGGGVWLHVRPGLEVGVVGTIPGVQVKPIPQLPAVFTGAMPLAKPDRVDQ
jgi:hypothetical protein